MIVIEMENERTAVSCYAPNSSSCSAAAAAVGDADDFEQDGKTPTNVMHNTFQLLDVTELQTGTNPFVEKDYLVRFFEKVPGFNDSNTYNFFHRKAFPNIRKFPSTAEIATAEFEGQLFYEQLRSDLNDQTKQVEEERQQEIFYKKIRTHQKDKFRNYMKYMAVVQGDGDNFGALISSIYKHNPNLTNDFSKTIFDFTQNAATKVSEILHGYPVYAGGDDILFFAPLAHTFFENDQVICIKTIFDVIDEIDKIFNKTIKEGILSTVISKSENPVSMSYGVSVAYYKFPLGEIQEYAANQLFGSAKQAKNKNAISIKVIKHSGNGFETTFLKPQDSGTKNAYTQFKDLLKCSVESPNFLRGIVHKLLLQEHVFSAIGSNKNLSERNAQFEQFFIQNFNEGVHTKKNKEGQKILIEFLQQLLVFCQIIYSENEVLTADNQKENMDYLRAALQFISFIHNKEESL